MLPPTILCFTARQRQELLILFVLPFLFVLLSFPFCSLLHSSGSWKKQAATRREKIPPKYFFILLHQINRSILPLTPKEVANPPAMASSSSTSNSAVSPVVAGSATTPGAGSPCAACKFLRRKCLPGCVFAPYFPPEEPQKFANVHRVFGASNVTKLLNELLPHQREDAVSSLAYEAEARVKDPVYGCVGAISVLQRQVHRLQKELDAAHAELLRYACGEVGIPTALPVTASPRLAAAMPAPGQLFAASAGMYGGRRLDGIVPPPPPPTRCYYMRNNAGSVGADVAPVLPYASMANWTVNAISTTTSGSESIGMDHKEGGDNRM